MPAKNARTTKTTKVTNTTKKKATAQPGPKPTTKAPFTNTNLAILFTVSLACSVASLGLSAYNLYRGAAPLTFSSFGADGNSAKFESDGSIASVASAVAPSVVSITTKTRTQTWFGQSQTSTAAGTGFIITADGYILTNKHVAEDSDSVSVTLDDGTTYTDVKVVGTDPLNDVAILKISGVSDLPALTLGDSKTIAVGQQVIAIGNALGLYQNTVTEGIISGTGRSLVASDGSGSSYEQLTDMIQTDAAINQGNSGGPLVNAAGEVIGINTAISSNSTGSALSFAIPISSVKGIIKSVVNTGEFQRAYLGVYYTALTPSAAKTYGLSTTAGAYVHNSDGSSAIVAGSAADKAGLKEGDIITAVNGVKIGVVGSLSTLLGEYTVGDTIQLTIERNGDIITRNVTLAPYADQSSITTQDS